MCLNNQPRLYGINNSNRDYTLADTWGKNQFNSSFPVSLACYLFHKEYDAVYIKANQTMDSIIDYISIEDLFGMNPSSENIFFSFETQFTPFQRFITGTIPRNDLVIMNSEDGSCVSTLEIKLTALPDNSTCNLSEDEFGSEIVVRPDTIKYLACSIIKKFENNVNELITALGNVGNQIIDWTDAVNVIPYIFHIKQAILNIVESKHQEQSPIIMEPIWKTEGKSPRLANNCLDVFVWSDFGMLNLFLPDDGTEIRSISRHTRSMIWLYKMLWDYCYEHHFDGDKIVDTLSYNTKNDKAFSTNGLRTHHFMNCEELHSPRITKGEIKNIILGGGQNLLSPERRFDAIIYNSPELFE